MDIIDDLFPPCGDSRRAHHANVEGAALPTASVVASTPTCLGSPLPSIALPKGFSLNFEGSVIPNAAPISVSLSSALVGRLIFTIIDAAAGLAIGPRNEWQPSARWLEKKAMQARGEPWPYAQPEGWHPSLAFRQLAEPLAAEQPPAATIAAVQAIMAEAFACLSDVSDERRSIANAFLPPTVAAPVADGTQRVRAAHPSSVTDKDGFVAVISRPDGSGLVPAFLPCPTPALQRFVAVIATDVARIAIKATTAEATEDLSLIASGDLDPRWRLLLVGFISLAATDCNMCSEHRRTFLKEHRVFKEASDCISGFV